jgi:oligosaccharide repeat unit polymerase
MSELYAEQLLLDPDMNGYETAPATVTLPKTSWLYIGWLLVAFLFCLALLLTYDRGFSRPVLVTGVGLYFLVFVVHVIRTWCRPYEADWLAPDFLFLMFFGLFHFGYLVPYLLGKVPYSERVFYSTDMANKSVLFSVLCGISFLFGYEVFGALRNNEVLVKPTPPSADMTLVVGKMLFMIGVLTTVTGGLIIGFGQATDPSFFAEAALKGIDVRIFAMGGVISSIGLIIYTVSSYRATGKLMSGIAFPLLIVIYLTLHFLSGRRAAFLLSALPIVLVYNYFKKSIKGRYVLALVLVAIPMMAVISTARAEASYNPLVIWKSIFSETEYGHFVSGATEAGGSLQTVNMTMTLVPGVWPYWKGLSYWSAVQGLLPNVFPQLRNIYSPSHWLTSVMWEKQVTGGAGLGSSIAMEAYLNFGLLGCLVLLLVGVFHRWLYDAALVKPTVTRSAVLIMATVGLCIWTRNWSFNYLRMTVWVLLICWTIEKIAAGLLPEAQK